MFFLFAVHAVVPASADGISRVIREEISGKTGKPVSTISVLSNGAIVKRAKGGKAESTRLSADDLARLEAAIASPDTLVAAVPECSPPLGADLSSEELTIEQDWRTVTLKLTTNCRYPEPVTQLANMLAEFGSRYFKQ